MSYKTSVVELARISFKDKGDYILDALMSLMYKPLKMTEPNFGGMQKQGLCCIHLSANVYLYGWKYSKAMATITIRPHDREHRLLGEYTLPAAYCRTGDLKYYNEYVLHLLGQGIDMSFANINQAMDSFSSAEEAFSAINSAITANCNMIAKKFKELTL